MALIPHAITDAAVNLTSEKIGKKVSPLIYESSRTIDTKCKIQCGKQPGDICLAVDPVCMQFSSKRK